MCYYDTCVILYCKDEASAFPPYKLRTALLGFVIPVIVLIGASGAYSLYSLEQEVLQEMISAVESSGLSVTAYNAVTQVLANDPELLAKIQQRAGVNN